LQITNQDYTNKIHPHSQDINKMNLNFKEDGIKSISTLIEKESDKLKYQRESRICNL